MRLPIMAEPVPRTVTQAVMSGGITASICTPCVAGKRICCSIFPPGCRVENCSGGPIAQVCGPCIPFIRKKFCVPGGLVNC